MNHKFVRRHRGLLTDSLADGTATRPGQTLGFGGECCIARSDPQPIAGTDSCQVEHFGYCLEGHMTVKMDDGSEAEIEQGQFFSIPPGHDAWVDDSRCVLLDFAESKEYAKRN